MKPTKRLPTKFVRVNRYTLIETDINVPDSETIRKFKENRERNKESLKNPDKRNIDFFRKSNMNKPPIHFGV